MQRGAYASSGGDGNEAVVVVVGEGRFWLLLRAGRGDGEGSTHTRRRTNAALGGGASIEGRAAGGLS